MLETRVETTGEGRRLRVARLGSGPPLVLLHGYPDNLQIWCELAPRLADRFRVIAFDWPGMGYSDPWPGGATPTHMAGRLLALLDAWHVERADLVGMDMGGQPALALAATHPSRVRRLVIMNSLVFWDEETSGEIAILRRLGWSRLILRRLPRAAFRRAERTSLPAGVRLPRELRQDLWASFRRDEVRAFIVRMCAGYQASLPRLPALYARIACPTLILWGARDRHFPPAHAERLHAAIRGSRVDVIRDAEHWMAWHLAAEVADRTREFAREGMGGP